MKSANEILDEIISATLARDAGLSDEEYRAKLGFKEGEEKQAKFTLMVNCTKEVIKLHQKLQTLDETIKKLQARKKAFQNRKERLKEYTLVAMKQHGIQKIECPECTISIQENNPSVDDYEPKLIPAEYWKQPEPVLDKKALLDDLKAGVIVQGARLKQTEGIRIR